MSKGVLLSTPMDSMNAVALDFALFVVVMSFVSIRVLPESFKSPARRAQQRVLFGEMDFESHFSGLDGVGCGDGFPL